MNILVTGGSGFIGSHFIEEFLKRNDVTKLYNLDANTYAANKNLPFDPNNIIIIIYLNIFYTHNLVIFL